MKKNESGIDSYIVLFSFISARYVWYNKGLMLSFYVFPILLILAEKCIVVMKVNAFFLKHQSVCSNISIKFLKMFVCQVIDSFLPSKYVLDKYREISNNSIEITILDEQFIFQ